MAYSVFQQIKNKIEEKKYKKLLSDAIEWINKTVESEEGFSVPYKLDEETGRLQSKTITPNNFEHGFHMDVWNNMTVPEQVLTLIWYDRQKAKEQNRPTMNFVLDAYKTSYEFEVNEHTLKLSIPTILFETGQKTSYEHLHSVSKMGVLLRDAHYKTHYLQTGENKGNFNEVYMSVADSLIIQPECYKNLIVQGFDQTELTEEDKKANKDYYAEITQEEKASLLLYLLQPRQNEWWKEYEKIKEIGERNVYYMGEDYNFEQYNKTVKMNKEISDKFILENTKDVDKDNLFFELLEADEEKEEEYEK